MIATGCGRPCVQGNRHSREGIFLHVPRGRDVVAKGCAALASPAAGSRPLKWKRSDDLRSVPYMVSVGATRDVVVDSAHAGSLEIGDRLSAVAANSVIEKHRLPLGRDQQCFVALTHINEVDLNLPNGLSPHVEG